MTFHNTTVDLRRKGAVYLLFQAVAGTVWWATILLAPSLRQFFLPKEVSETVLLSLLLPDLFFYIGTSAIAAIGLLTRRPWQIALHVHLGASWYASLFCLALSILTGQGWASVAFMLPAASISSYFAWRLRR